MSLNSHLTGIDNHLTEQDILIAAVDPADLSTRARAHLANCPACTRELAGLADGLTGLTGLARAIVPNSRTRFRMPDQGGLLTKWFHRPLTFAAGAAATAAVALAIWFSVPVSNNQPGPTVNSLIQPTEETAPMEMRARVRSPLPAADLAAIEETAPLIARTGYENGETMSGFHRFVIGSDDGFEDDTTDDNFIDQLAPAVESI